eukprot:CAMPEP_0117449316 /NCGR_PEP_ID=MMETSP0759-20121206/7883_1 /TAXON_ID=63605 /ORGANISM="Percolomonas cosmopolitus, Strain WS" /LENGTH=337 /DNA_ID=CAMNT_0005241789 /DNA_START=374 /DNA_END=1383 /DNA_ORIENTATION=+
MTFNGVDDDDDDHDPMHHTGAALDSASSSPASPARFKHSQPQRIDKTRYGSAAGSSSTTTSSSLSSSPWIQMAEHVDRHAARGGTASQRHHAGFSTNNAALSESPLLHPFQSRPHNLIVPSLAESNHNLPTSITSHDLHNGLSLLSPESFRDKDIDRLLGIGSDEGSDGGEYANDHHFHDGDQNRQLSRKRKTMNGRNRRRKKSSGNHDDSLRDSDSDSETSSFYSNEESDGGSTQSSERHKASPFDIRSGERMDESQMLLGTSLQSGDSSHEEDEHSFSDDAQRIVNIDEHVDAILNEEGDILLEEESGHDEHVTQHHDFTDALSTHADDSITEEG